MNIKPAYVKVKMSYNYTTFIKYLPNSCLGTALENAFRNQFETLRDSADAVTEDGKNPTVLKFPITSYKMDCIQDETNASDEYKKNMLEKRAYYRLDKTLVKPSQEFCAFEH